MNVFFIVYQCIVPLNLAIVFINKLCICNSKTTTSKKLPVAVLCHDKAVMRD